MMSNKPIIKCPFILCNERKAVECEGISDESLIKLIFKSEELKKDYVKEFCMSEYESCKLYKMLEEKYEE